MFEKIAEFFKKQFKNAFHAVSKSFSSFIALFLSVLLIECIFFTVFLAFDQNMDMRKDAAESTYDHHVVLSGIDNVQLSQLYRYAARSESSFGHYIIQKETEGAVYIKLLTGNKDTLFFEDDSLETNYKAMCDEVGFDVSRYASFTPLYTLGDDLSSLTRTRNAVLLVLGIILSLILLSFYTIHINNEKYVYGLYAAFGGKNSRLCLNAWSELWVCALISLLPAYIISETACFFMYRAHNVDFSVSILNIPLWLTVLFWVLLIALFAVVFSISRISFAEPMRLIEAQNNTNLIVSPRSSFDFLRVKFPFGYEWVSALRFRRHYLTLACTSALLCACFVAGCFTSLLYTNNKEIKSTTEHDLSVRFFNATVLPDSYATYFSSITGVSSAHVKYASLKAGDLAHLLYVPGSAVTNGSSLAMDPSFGTYFTGDLNYIAASGLDTVRYLSETYTVRGSADTLLDSPDNILIGSSFQNQSAFSFAVGDMIEIAVPKTDEDGELIYKDKDDPFVSNVSGKELWREQHEKISYEKRTFRIVGIIDDYPSAKEGIPIVFHYKTYEELTDQAVKADTLYIKAQKDLTLDDFVKLQALLNRKAESLNPGQYLVETPSSFFENKMQELSAYNELILFICGVFLLFVPMNWFYSQHFFFKRRFDEFYALHSISASLSRIRSIFLCDAVLMLPIGILSGGLAFGLSKLAEWIFSYVLPNFFATDNAIAQHPALPSYVYILCIGLSFISCILSALFPYLSYRKLHKKAYLAETLTEE